MEEIALYQNEWPWSLFRGRLRSCQPLRHIRHWMSRKPLEIEACLQRTTNRKWPMRNRMVTWPMTSRDRERSISWSQYCCFLRSVGNWFHAPTREVQRCRQSFVATVERRSHCLSPIEELSATECHRLASATGCLPDSPKPDSPKLGLWFRVMVRVRFSANRE